VTSANADDAMRTLVLHGTAQFGSNLTVLDIIAWLQLYHCQECVAFAICAIAVTG